MAQDFGGFEPLVGEITAVRTFRIDASGSLLPLYSHEVWYDGMNVAECAPPTGDRDRPAHVAPDEHCQCGFYAYGDRAVARRSRQSRHVLAVVSCWGHVVAGTFGVRAQYARVDAVWLSPRAPGWLARRVAMRYPSARVYADVDAMLAEHPPTRLPCYTDARRTPRPASALAAATAVPILALGLLPGALVCTAPFAFLWLVAVAAAVVLTGWFAVADRRVGHLAAAVVLAAVLAWLVSPLLGLPGWLLRLPLLRAFAGAGGAALLRLRPGYFPVLRTERDRRPYALRV